LYLKGKKIKIILTSLILILITQGCSSAKIRPIKEPAIGDKAIITVYRPYKIEENINNMIVSINNVDISILKSKQFTRIYIPSGEHTVSARYSMGFEAHETINIKPNQNIYLKASGSSGSDADFIPGSIFFRQRFYIQKSKRISTKDYVEIPISYN